MARKDSTVGRAWDGEDLGEEIPGRRDVEGF